MTIFSHVINIAHSLEKSEVYTGESRLRCNPDFTRTRQEQEAAYTVSDFKIDPVLSLVRTGSH
jgi:hypothetical protein